MNIMASQIMRNLTVCSAPCWSINPLHYCPFMRWNPQRLEDFPKKRPVMWEWVPCHNIRIAVARQHILTTLLHVVSINKNILFMNSKTYLSADQDDDVLYFIEQKHLNYQICIFLNLFGGLWGLFGSKSAWAQCQICDELLSEPAPEQPHKS